MKLPVASSTLAASQTPGPEPKQDETTETDSNGPPLAIYYGEYEPVNVAD
jgi:hypothetical protein